MAVNNPSGLLSRLISSMGMMPSRTVYEFHGCPTCYATPDQAVEELYQATLNIET